MDQPEKLPKELFDVMSGSFERLGLSIDAVVALFHPERNRPPSIKIRGDLSSEGPEYPNFEIKVLIYDESGDLICEGNQHFPAETFGGFDTIDIWVDDVITTPVRIRILAKAWG
jgi:hypothetical protein